jgi:hypothetical protein
MTTAVQTVVRDVRAPSAEQLKAAQWVDGRVVMPKGVPADEKMVVTADAVGSAGFDRHSVDVGVDGKFRVAFAGDAKRGHLRLSGRYLLLENAAVWIAGETGVELKPVLGGWLRGHVKGQWNGDEKAEVLATPIELEGTPLAPGKVGVKRSLRIDEGFGWEAGGLPSGYQWTVTLVAGPFAPVVVDVADVGGGQAVTADLSLTRGARLRGRVMDGEVGVGDAVVHVIAHEDPLAPEPADCGKVRTGADGGFEIRGVPVGDATVWAAKEGWISEQGVIEGLREGEARDGVSLKLRAGNVLQGRVLDPEGKPAEGARVRVTQSSVGQADLVREVVTGVDGSFSAAGLGDEPVDVFVTRDWTGASMGKQRAQRATAKGVNPATKDLVITLVAGMVIEGRVQDDLGRLVQSFSVVARAETGKDPQKFEDETTFSVRDVRDRDGKFLIDYLAPGTWNVWISGTGLVSDAVQRVKVPYEGEALHFIVRRTAVVSGVVVDGKGKAVSEALVEVSWDHPALFRGGATHGSTSVTCSREGKFELTGVYPGAVKVEARITDGRGSGSVELKLESGETRGDVEIVMTPGAPR